VRYDVYCHTSPSGKKYVGWTRQGWRKRWRSHVKDARAGRPLAFHAAIRKHGADTFTHEVLDRLSTEEGARRAERLWIARLSTIAPGGYNLTSGGEGTLNPPEDVRFRMGANRGRKMRDETRKRMSETHRKRKRDAFTYVKIAEALRGRKRSPETIAKMSAAAKGKKHSAETRAKMSASHKARAARVREVSGG
jgi:group I intron endonuclease